MIKHKQYILIFLAIGFVVFAMYFIVSRQGSAIEQEPVEEKSSQVVSDNEQRINATELQKKLSEIISSYPDLEIGLSIASPQLETPLAVDGDVPFVAASTTKVITAAYALHQVQLGKVALTDTIGGDSLYNNISNMIVYSDNDAWLTLLEYFGFDNITNFGNRYSGGTFNSINNTITANDMASFVSVILIDDTLSVEQRELIEKLLTNSDTGPIVLDSPFNTIAKKAGWLEDRIHLTGIVENKKTSNRVSFAIFIKSTNGATYPFESGNEIINKVLNTVAEATP